MTGDQLSVVAFHPSDESYGADRVLAGYLVHGLEHWAGVDVLIPNDVAWTDPFVTRTVGDAGGRVRHVPLPVARRALLAPAGWPRFAKATFTGLPLARRAAAAADFAYINSSAMLPVALAVPRRVPVLLHLHECWSSSDRRLLSPLLPAVDAIVAVSSASALSLPPRWRDRAVVVPNGLEPRTPPSHEDRLAARRRLDLPSDALVVLCASRWNAWKGHRTLLSAWQQARPAGGVLAVLGSVPPAGTGFDVVAAVGALNGVDVRVPGQTAAVADWLAACDVVAVPSIQPDPLPTIALEALRAGRPLLVSDTGGLPQIIGGSGSGQLTAPGDVSSWASALAGLPEWLAAADREALARQRFDEAFTVERAHAAMDAVVAGLVSARRGRTRPGVGHAAG